MKSSNTMKSMWDVVKVETGRSRRVPDYTEVLQRSDGAKFSSIVEVVNSVNEHFIRASTSCNAPTAEVAASVHALASARSPADRSMRIKKFTPREVFRVITHGVARKTSSDLYDTSISLLYSTAEPLSYILSALYNKCIEDGIYPAALKQVKVSPLYKGKGKQEEIYNYRPVSIIPAVAKVFEYGLSSRLTEYLVESEALSERQHAYRRGHSTTSITRELLREILNARERRQQVAVIFCDLSKAFDVADHGVLAAKLEHYGIRNNVLRLMSDYLSGRSQVVVGEGGVVRSKPLTTVIGVAQGSSLSNILFSLLLNDLPENIENSHVLMYADDVAAVVTARDMIDLELKLNRVACGLHRWFRMNGLILNMTKTHFVQYDLSGHIKMPLNVVVGSTKIDQVKETLFLGFRIDNTLTWESHINELCLKIGRACFALWRLSGVLPTSMVKNCYFASVHSLLQYGVEFWARSADWERVFRMQKRAVRAVARVPEDTPAQELFRSLRILTLPCMLILQAALYAWDHLDEYPRLRTARHAHVLCAPPHRLEKTSRQVHVMAADIYNRLPADVKEAPSRNSFKMRAKFWLTKEAFYQ